MSGTGAIPAPLRAALGAIVSTALDAALLALALGGPARVLAHPRAVALLAGWLVAAFTLAWLRPVRAHRPVAGSADPPWVMPALFALPLATPAISAFGERAGLWPMPGGEALRWAGVALALGGLALRIVAIASLGSRFSPRVAVQEGHALETAGLYARVRHPGYLGAWLAALGAALAFGSALGLVPVALMRLALEARMRREEALLERHFGDAWRDYAARAGRFLPRWVVRRA